MRGKMSDKKFNDRVEPDIKITIAHDSEAGKARLETVADVRCIIDFDNSTKRSIIEIQKSLNGQIKAGYENFVSQYDKNRDGKVTDREIVEFVPEDKATELFPFDVYAKIAQQRIAGISTLDANKDGFLTEEELHSPTELPKPRHGNEQGQNPLI